MNENLTVISTYELIIRKLTLKRKKINEAFTLQIMLTCMHLIMLTCMYFFGSFPFM